MRDWRIACAGIMFFVASCNFIQPQIGPLPTAQPSEMRTVAPQLSPSASSASVTASGQPAPSASPSFAPTVAPTPTSVDLSGISKVTRGIVFGYSHAVWLFSGTRRDPQSVLEKLACGLKPDHVKILFYWSWMQDDGPGSLKWDYNVAWQLATLKRCGVKSVTVVIGEKTGRWPECHTPPWAKKLTLQERETARRAYMVKVVERLGNEPLVKAIQVENEPFHHFTGECGQGFPMDVEVYKQEVAAVRATDPLHRDIVVAESGDWEDWTPYALLGDIFSTTYYWYSTHNGVFTDYTYRNRTPAYWRERMNAVEATGKRVRVGEFQWEPWEAKSLKELTPAEALKNVTPEQIRKQLKFVLDTGVTHIDVWGGEWLVYMDDQGSHDMWNFAQDEVFARE